MVISQNRFSNNSTKKEVKPIKLNLDIMMYDALCRYVIQNSSYVRMEHLVNLRKLLIIIDYSTYENDPEKSKRVKFLFKALEARLDHNINDRDIILTYVNGGLTFPIDFLDYNRLDLSKDEIVFIHNLVSETLQYQFLYNRIDDIQDICTRFKTTDYMNRGGIVKEFEELIDSLKNDFRRSKLNDNAIDMVFSLKEGRFESAVTDTYNLITNPSRRLITGMQGLNELTGGGFESGRVYMLLGTSGVGKSITLLNLIYQMKLYNPNYRTKDPTKTPCIVLLTMENTVVETITRLFDLVIENSLGMANYSIDEVLKMMREEGKLVVNTSSPIDIVIKYKANKSVNTSYLYSLYDDLYDEGYEMICLVQDHVKRIRSAYGGTDLRIELGDIVNELKVFAADKDIPVLTNSHLNRDAAKIIEDAARKNNVDVGKLLGKSNIGESMLMIDNLDGAYTITLDYDKEGNRYMAFNNVKIRDKISRTYIAQPFVKGSTIRLLEDLGGIPQFKETIHGTPELKHNSIIKISGASNIQNFTMDDLEEEENSFAMKNYTLDPTTDNNKFRQSDVVQPMNFAMMNSIQSDISSLKQQISLNSQGEIVSKPIICPIYFTDTGEDVV